VRHKLLSLGIKSVLLALDAFGGVEHERLLDRDETCRADVGVGERLTSLGGGGGAGCGGMVYVFYVGWWHGRITWRDDWVTERTMRRAEGMMHDGRPSRLIHYNSRDFV
jgi:hypothetical protein